MALISDNTVYGWVRAGFGLLTGVARTGLEGQTRKDETRERPGISVNRRWTEELAEPDEQGVEQGQYVALVDNPEQYTGYSAAYTTQDLYYSVLRFRTQYSNSHDSNAFTHNPHSRAITNRTCTPHIHPEACCACKRHQLHRSLWLNVARAEVWYPFMPRALLLTAPRECPAHYAPPSRRPPYVRRATALPRLPAAD
eukprot:scaffold18520_cov71-Phaeocystis_antarctica.AAC.1